MKIGILTYHRAENYGALLQAYALLTYLGSLGHEVSFIDYWPKYHSDYFKIFSWATFTKRPLKSKLLMLVRLVLMGNKLLRRKKVMQQFMHEQLRLPDTPTYTTRDCETERYDVAVYGSDQIWRKQNLGGVGFDEWFFGSDNVQADKKIVYAGSMGKLETAPEDILFVKAQMQNFQNIAVREKDLQDYLQQQGIASTLVIDPVFLLTKEQWHRLAVAPQSDTPYILFYNLLNTPESTAFAKELSKKTGLPIKEITKKTVWGKKGNRFIDSASVQEFLGLVEHAAYVVSNSFHGVAFSVIFEKQFYAVGMGEKSNRVVSLLESAGIKERYVETRHGQITASEIDYAEVTTRIEDETKKSKDYLLTSLSREDRTL
jgi:hypothetical protein